MCIFMCLYNNVFAEAQVNFTKEVYVVTEGEDEYVQVCITLSDGVSLDSSYGSANFNISTTNTSGWHSTSPVVYMLRTHV